MCKGVFNESGVGERVRPFEGERERKERRDAAALYLKSDLGSAEDLCASGTRHYLMHSVAFSPRR